MTVQQFDVLEVTARGEFNGIEDVVNVFQYRYESVPPIADNLAVDDILNIMETLYIILNGAITILQLYRDIRIANQTQGTLMGRFSWPTLVAGAGIGPTVAPGVAFLTSLTTPVPRVGMRKYWGVMTDANMDADGTWGAAIVVAGLTVNIAMLNPFAAVNGSWQFGYTSPKTLAFEIPTGGVVTDIPAYQRRRRQGRGS